MQIILNAREMDDFYYYSQFYMATFPILRLHDAKTLTYIYLISVSINRYTVSINRNLISVFQQCRSKPQI